MICFELRKLVFHLNVLFYFFSHLTDIFLVHGQFFFEMVDLILEHLILFLDCFGEELSLFVFF